MKVGAAVRLKVPAAGAERVMVVTEVACDHARCVWPAKEGPDGVAEYPLSALEQVVFFVQTFMGATTRHALWEHPADRPDEWRKVMEDPPEAVRAAAPNLADELRVGYDAMLDFIRCLPNTDPLGSVSLMKDGQGNTK